MGYSRALVLCFLFSISLLIHSGFSARILAESTEKTQSVDESKYFGSHYGHYGGGHYGGGHYGGGHYGGGHYGGGHYGGGGGHYGHWPPQKEETKDEKTEVVKPEHYGGGGYGHGGYGGYGHGGYGGYGHGGYGGYGHGGYGHGGYGHGGYGHGGYGHGGYGGHWPPTATKTTEEQKGN